MASRRSEWNTDDKPIKVDKWDGSAVKNALDDAVKKIFTEKYKCIESHRLMDGRLLICTVAVGAAMFALFWDYLYPFPESRTVLIICVLSYFALMAVLTFYTSFIEKNIFLVAIQRDAVDPDRTWTVTSNLKRFDDMYHLCITYSDGRSSSVREDKLENSISNWFDEDGVLHMDLFEPEVSKLYASLSSEKKQK